MSNDETIQLTQRVLNGKPYVIGVSLFNTYLGYNFRILDSMILSIRIDNDLDSFYPKCSVIFEDISGKYTNLYTHFGQYIEIIIVSPRDTQNASKNTAKINLTFRIIQHKLIQYNVRKPKYEIIGISFYESAFNQHLNYATNKQLGLKSPYFLIKNILSQVSIDITKQIPPCTRTIHFISDQNKTIADHIKYCLYMGASQKDPPTFLYYHLIDQQFLLVNRDSILKQPQYSCNFQLVIPSDNGNQKIDNALILYNVEAYSNLKSQEFYQDTSLQHRWIYDQIQRRWTQTIIKPQRYQQLLSIDDKSQTKLKSSFDIKTYDESNIRFYTTNYEYNIYSRLHNLQVGSNCLQFYVQGNIIRDCGQVLNINCLNKNFSNIYGRNLANIQCNTFNIG